MNREHLPSIVVATLSSALGAMLLHVNVALSVAVHADPRAGQGQTAGLLMSFATVIFMLITLVVGAIVTANTFAAIVAGRIRTIALLRLLGSSANRQRRTLAREGLGVGLLGAALGAVLGTALGVGLMAAAVGLRVAPEVEYPWASPLVVLPAIAVVITTWAASWFGAARVTEVSPLEALSAAEEREPGPVGRVRRVVSLSLIGSGVVLLVLGIFLGVTGGMFGVFVAVVGGIISFVGIITGAEMLIPPVLTLIGKMFGSSPAARMATRNAVRYPERSARSAIGVVIPVTLVTMFAVALGTFQDMVNAARRNEPELYAGIEGIFTTTLVVVAVLIGFAAVIAGIGLANTLSITVHQRTREIGLLRTLGFTRAQVRSMIRVEGAQLSIAAVLVGCVLGIFYGWAGTQALLGWVNGSPGLVWPTVPWGLLVGVAVLTGVLTLTASLAPMRRATRVSPVAALAL